MNLNNLIAVRVNFEERIKQELLEMDCFFQDRMWDGSTDNENDPKFISREDFEAIEALSDKIKHMILNIGCPNSVEPMLLSIISRKIKHWQAHDNVETKDVTRYHYNNETKEGKTIIVKKGFKKGRQLKNSNDLDKVYNIDGYYHIPIEKRVISGHFRWNNRGYLLSRLATDLLDEYYETKF
ncbi:hypothetical protein [Flavobacterium sp.]|uniref:hypothetical protein n=1 Tax=Flavobacterium sp. TaxID=239 RepID=UPI002616E240|nr:hypothetical protein [Flavobacterium sp.]